jgi:predicted nucleic acid-binding protein
MTDDLRAVFDTNVLISAMLLDLAVSGRATHIVTGDSDLLVLHPFRGIIVVSPSEFLTSA